MITQILGFSYIIISFAIFLYSIKSNKANLKSYGYSILLYTIPLCLLPTLGEEQVKFLGVPIVYLLFISCSIASIFRSKFTVNIKYKKLLLYMFIFLIYTFVVSAIKNLNFSFFQYYFIWIINFLIVLSVGTISAEFTDNEIFDIFRFYSKVLFLCELVGILRYVLQIAEDANFLSIMNRNGTIFLDLTMTPILFFLIKEDQKNKKKYFVYIFVKILYIVFTFSRMGILSFFVSIACYYIMMNRKKVFKLYIGIFLGLLIAIIIMISPLKFNVFERMYDTIDTIDIIVNHKPFNSSMKDYSRYKLMQDSIEVIKNNYIFGTGSGVKSYILELEKVTTYRMSRPHNFYLSYFAELGVVGFSILMLIFLNLTKFMKTRFINLNITFLVTLATLFTMNEYITIALIWVVFGLISGRGIYYKNLNNNIM